MTKRKKKAILGGFEFSKIDPYGGTESAEKPTPRIHIEAILPDPDQPRTLLPTDLYTELFNGARPLAILKVWLERAQAPGAPPVLTHSVNKVHQLAKTIQHTDLINPITVRTPPAGSMLPTGVRYIIVTGERRWWSHLLLTLQETPIVGQEHPDRIKATVVADTQIRALQLIENVAREDLSVIEKAQGMLALKAELVANKTGKVGWADVEEILGLSRSYRSRILKVLKLTPEAQELVARYGLLEKTIRPINEHLQDKPDLQLIALQQIISWQQAEGEPASHKRIAAYVQTLLATPSKRKRASRDDASWWVAKFQQRVTGALQLFDTLDEQGINDIATIINTGHEDGRQQLEQLRDKLNAILE